MWPRLRHLVDREIAKLEISQAEDDMVDVKRLEILVKVYRMFPDLVAGNAESNGIGNNLQVLTDDELISGLGEEG